MLLLLLLAMPTARADSIDSLRQVVKLAEGKQKTDAYNQLCQALNKEGKADEQLAVLEEWIIHERQYGDAENEGKARWKKIAVLNNFGRDEAMHAEAPVQMAWFEEHEQWERYYNTWESKASSYLYTGKVQTAMHEAQLMLEDAQKRDNDFGRVVSYILTGITYQTMGQNDAALSTLERAYNLLRSGNYEKDLFFLTCDYICQTLDAQANYQRELQLSDEWLQEINKQRQQRNNPGSYMGTLLSCHLQRASSLMGLQRYDEAWQEVDEANHCVEYINIPLTSYRILFIRARLLEAEGRATEALACLDSLEAMQLEVGGGLNMLRADVLTKLNRHAEAAQLFRQQYYMLDSVFSRDMRSQLDELSTLYQLDEQKRVSQMERSRDRSRFLLLIASIVLVALLGFLFFRYRSAKRMEQKNRELKQANDELTKANQRAEDSLKMKSDFIKSISHEIRTPLNILSGFTQVITSPNNDFQPDQLADIHRRINENTERIVKLVDKMMALSDSNTHNSLERNDYVTVREIVQEAVRMTGVTSTEQVAFDWDTQNELAFTRLFTNQKYAARALSCLLENAQKFTIEGMIAIRLLKQDTKLFIAVEDTGIGVPPDQAQQIFEEFVQLDQYSPGAGIGLSVARNIARRLGGDITLDTKYTSGARFIMTLPV